MLCVDSHFSLQFLIVMYLMSFSLSLTSHFPPIYIFSFSEAHTCNYLISSSAKMRSLHVWASPSFPVAVFIFSSRVSFSLYRLFSAVFPRSSLIGHPDIYPDDTLFCLCYHIKVKNPFQFSRNLSIFHYSLHNILSSIKVT